MRGYTRGFTLMELVIVICIIIIAILATVPMLGSRGPDVDKANKAIEKKAARYKNVTGFDCISKDSDGDGYCTCSIYFEDNTEKAFECGCERWCWWNCAKGCKPKEFKVYRTRVRR